MFTGIVEEKGKIKQMNQVTKDAIQLAIEAKRILADIHVGDSIAVNGVCLTVTAYTSNSFTADVMPETIEATSLRELIIGSEVNLERAMHANGRFGGHFVSGHIDTTGDIIQSYKRSNAIYKEIRFPAQYRPFFHLKGSVALDGVSLTIFALTDDTLTISLIPHSAQETVLGMKELGDIVNIECDMLAKHVHQLLQYETKQRSEKSSLSLNKLLENGFI